MLHLSPPPSVMLGGSSSKNKDAFLASARAAREERNAERHRERCATLAQAAARGWMERRRQRRAALEEFDSRFPQVAHDAPEAGMALATAAASYAAARRFLVFCNPGPQEWDRFERLCRYVLASLNSSSPKTSYISVALGKQTALEWIAHMKRVLLLCSERLDSLRLDSASAGKELSTMLRMLVAFTSTSGWALLKIKSMEKLAAGMNQLCANFMGHLVQAGFAGHLKRLLLRGICGQRVLIKKTSLSAVMTLAMRPVVSADFSVKLVSIFLLNVLSVPGLIAHLGEMSPDSLALLQRHETLARCVALLSNEQQMKIHFNALEGSYALCLTANLVHLVSLQTKEEFDRIELLDLVSVLTRLLESCGQYVTAKQSNLSHWHPVLGWFSVNLDSYLQDSMDKVKYQLSRLWSPNCLKLLTRPLTELVDKLPPVVLPPTAQPDLSPEETSSAKQLFKKAMEKAKSSNTCVSKGPYTKLGSPECMKISLTCNMFQNALKTLSQLRNEILLGLSYQNILILPLWRLIQSFGPQCGLKAFLDHLSANSKGTAPEFQMLILFCDCLAFVVTVLDDIEMYEKQTPFTLSQYIQISAFLNSFLYKAVSSGLIVDPKTPVFSSLHALLMVLYERDNRRAFARSSHWLIKEIRVSSFMSDLEKCKKSSTLLVQKMPHILPHDDRVVLFRRKVAAEKASLGLADQDAAGSNSTLITVHRTRIVEDGDRQLSGLSSTALKGVIRVKFVNVQGLDEAGIDQDGVFKEFLEETIKKVFDPGLNLFCTTSEERLYPSPVSHLTDNHLHLFEFVGRMIGKAVYEGIVVDVPFAPFFLSQVLGKHHDAYYSYVDELPSLDSELYRNLTYVKHYSGDVSDLDLTFSFDQDMMGQIITHELVPGGRGLAVTNENKINYMHLIARFRMHTQIRDQTVAFTRGFRSIVPLDWLQLFSSSEVQRLISGDNSPLDLKDLRKHTHYYGGFHDSHRVVSWLWEILEKDFSDKERAAFLKFVTSCSKPPLLGFEHLESPFSIRCVEVGDDEDDRDTVGSMLRGFLAIKRKDPVNRLPTASTCFNLLKLPNYQKKSTLREKLRYAISCNTGFELS